MDIFEYCNSEEGCWTYVDNWIPRLGEDIVKETKNSLIFPVSEFFYGPGKESVVLDNFILTPKRCYNSNDIRSHMCRYINYFEKFYDKEHELLFYIYHIKAKIDIGVMTDGQYVTYTQDEFKRDIVTYILSDSIYVKTWNMVNDNYILQLNYKNKSNEGLQYTDMHGKYLMEICVLQNFIIPLIMHFCYKNRYTSTEMIHDLIYTIFNHLFNYYTDPNIMAKRGLKMADIYSKLYETAITTMETHYKTNKTLWDMSSIRGFDPVINANDAVNTVIMMITPKLTFVGNIITYIITSVRNNPRYNVGEIAYEFDYVSKSSSKRDGEDNTSEFDKYEAHLIKTDESLALQNDFRANLVMSRILMKGGYVGKEEIDFYRKELTRNGQFFVNKFQQNLIYNMFYKYFGDTNSINSINGDDYITLMIIAKRLLLEQGMKILPYIISSRVERISSRNTLCKKETNKIIQSEYYNDLLMKYKNDEESKPIKTFKSLVTTILSSGFRIIDFDNPDLNGKEVVMESDIVIDEFMRFILAV